MYKMTAAHKTLPLPSYVEVTNVENNKKVVVRVNDRGPFHEGRIIDLSYSAAWKLDVIKKGTAKVKIRVLTPDDAPPMAQQLPYIQFGLFLTRRVLTRYVLRWHNRSLRYAPMSPPQWRYVPPPVLDAHSIKYWCNPTIMSKPSIPSSSNWLRWGSKGLLKSSRITTTPQTTGNSI
mgnify:CR=1 FL=1